MIRFSFRLDLIFYETVLENRGKRGSLVFNGWLPNSVPILAQRRDIYVYHRERAAEQCSLFIYPKSSSVKVQKQIVVLLLLLLLIYLL
jgi:hypothetical protein